jgi:hypothetical protein
MGAPVGIEDKLLGHQRPFVDKRLRFHLPDGEAF